MKETKLQRAGRLTIKKLMEMMNYGHCYTRCGFCLQYAVSDYCWDTCPIGDICCKGNHREMEKAIREKDPDTYIPLAMAGILYLNWLTGAEIPTRLEE